MTPSQSEKPRIQKKRQAVMSDSYKMVKRWIKEYGPLPEGSTHVADTFSNYGFSICIHKVEGESSKSWSPRVKKWVTSGYSFDDCFLSPIPASCFLITKKPSRKQRFLEFLKAMRNMFINEFKR